MPVPVRGDRAVSVGYALRQRASQPRRRDLLYYERGADWVKSSASSSSRRMTTLLGASIPKRTLSLPSRTTVRTIDSPSFTLWLSLLESTSIRNLRVAGDIWICITLEKPLGRTANYSPPLFRRAKGYQVPQNRNGRRGKPARVGARTRSRGRSVDVWVSVDVRRFGQFRLLKALATRTVK